MTVEPGNSPLFFAYNIRSAFLTLEAELQETLSEWGLTPEQFYVLRCDWTGQDKTTEQIIAHAMLSRKKSFQALNDLLARGYIKNKTQEGCYSLTPQGVSLRTQLLTAYHAQISSATQGLSNETIEVGLSSLLTIQNNIQQV